MSAAAGQSGTPSGGTSSFGQFRLTTFVDLTPKQSKTSTTSPLLRNTSVKSVRPQSFQADNAPILSSHASETLSRPSASAPSPSTTSTSKLQSTSVALIPSTNTVPTHTQAAFRTLDLAPPHPAREGKLGPHRDGRVRNPVPRKLKGKTDDKNGNFAVMHMDMSGTDAAYSLPRAEAAQRTSESTAKAAKSAQKDGYVPVKRRRVQTTSDTPSSQDAAITIDTRLAVSPPSQVVDDSRVRAMTSEETKYEQARLLTLLRSINPLTVVDQICKALAFFGGIPGAPPPEDGSFPESAEANGSGALFVGWLSEIFPKLDRQGWKSEMLKAMDVHEGKRPRGRPKGSKASKVRKDKGVKKGPKYTDPDCDGTLQTRSLTPHFPAASGQEEALVNPEDEWIDIGKDDSRTDQEIRPGIPSSSTQKSGTISGHIGADQHSDSVTTMNRDIGLVAKDQESGLSYIQSTPNGDKHRSGKSKGSRNRPRTSGFDNSPGQELDPAHPILSPQPRTRSTDGHWGSGRLLEGLNQNVTTGASSIPQLPASTKAAFSGSPRLTTTITTERQPTQPKKRSVKSSKPSIASAPARNLNTEATTSARPLQIEQFPQKTTTPSQTASAPVQNVQATLGEKRKRPSSKALPYKTQDTSSAAQRESLTRVSDIQNVSSNASTSQNPAEQNAGPSVSSQESRILPPAKRQRKPKEPGNAARKKNPVQKDKKAFSASPSVPQTLPPATTTPPMGAPDPILAVCRASTALPAASRPPAQGLEAHYQRFATLQVPQQLQEAAAQAQSQSLRDQSSMARSSPMLSSSIFYQTQQQHPRQQPQLEPQSQAPNQPLGDQSNIARSSPMLSSNIFYQPHQQQQQAERSQYYHTNDSYRGILNNSNNSQQNTHPSFASRQQPTQQQFNQFSNSAFIDVPALESVANGTASVSPFGQGLSRSTSNGSFNGTHSQLGVGIGVGNGFQAGLNDNELRERLLKGMGAFGRR